MSDTWTLLKIANGETVNLEDEIAEWDRDYEKLQAENTHLRSKLAKAVDEAQQIRNDCYGDVWFQTVGKLRAELAEAKKDGERLDWYFSSAADDIEIWKIGEDWVLQDASKSEFGYEFQRFFTTRNGAIDAAMSEGEWDE
jgi:predicted RNase H-like nuclease (RuvC/YqgF family)